MFLSFLVTFTKIATSIRPFAVRLKLASYAIFSNIICNVSARDVFFGFYMQNTFAFDFFLLVVDHRFLNSKWDFVVSILSTPSNTPPPHFIQSTEIFVIAFFYLRVYIVSLLHSVTHSLSFSLCPHYHVIILISHITFNTQIQKAAMKDTEDITKLSNNLMQFGISSYCYLLVFRLVFLPCYFSLC